MDKIQNNMIIENELMVSLGLVRHGLSYLYNDNGEEDILFVFLQLSSSGLERLLKLIITCNSKEKKGNFVNKTELKTCYNHNLENALSFIKLNIDSSFNYDNHLNGILKLFSDFGYQDRYENLNILGGENCISYKKKFNDSAQSICKISTVSDAEMDIKQQNIKIIEKLFSFTNSLLNLLDKVYPNGKNNALLYRQQFNDISELLRKFEQKKVSVFD